MQGVIPTQNEDETVQSVTYQVRTKYRNAADQAWRGSALQYLQLQPAQQNEPYVNLHNRWQVGPFLEIVTAYWQVQGTQITCSLSQGHSAGVSEKREQELNLR